MKSKYIINYIVTNNTNRLFIFLKQMLKNYSILNCLLTFLTIDGIIDNLNNYTLVYVGIHGENFCSSAYMTTKLFRRNLVFGLVNGKQIGN
jgi:hypothetical protein